MSRSAGELMTAITCETKKNRNAKAPYDFSQRFSMGSLLNYKIESPQTNYNEYGVENDHQPYPDTAVAHHITRQHRCSCINSTHQQRNQHWEKQKRQHDFPGPDAARHRGIEGPQGHTADRPQY